MGQNLKCAKCAKSQQCSKSNLKKIKKSLKNVHAMLISLLHIPAVTLSIPINKTRKTVPVEFPPKKVVNSSHGPIG